MKQIIEELQGTAKSLNEVCNSFGLDSNQLTIEELELLDEEIFQCQNCGWWVDVTEKNERDFDFVCNECFEEDQ